MNDLRFETVEESFPFIRKVFDYYNGRINVFFPVVEFNIVTVRSYSAIMGRAITIGEVNIYPYNCVDSDAEQYRFNIVYTIIHELFHIDQHLRSDIDDPEYRMLMEEQCEFMTQQYILSHVDEIESLTGINVYDFICYVSVYPYILYRRKTYSEYFLLNIYSILDMNFDPDFEQLVQTKVVDRIFRNENFSFIFNLNGNKLVIYDNGCFCTIDDFVKFTYNHYHHADSYCIDDVKLIEGELNVELKCDITYRTTIATRAHIHRYWN